MKLMAATGVALGVGGSGHASFSDSCTLPPASILFFQPSVIASKRVQGCERIVARYPVLDGQHR